MLEYQEKWVAHKGYVTLSVKTRNQFNAMLNMLVSRQYQITVVEADQSNISQHKLHLQKQLNLSATQ